MQSAVTLSFSSASSPPHGGHVLILRCAHVPNLAKGVVCGHKNRSGSYGNKIALICMKIELVCRLKHFGIQEYVSTYHVE